MMELLINKYTKKWLGVPNSLTNVELYSSSTKLKLPALSLVEEYNLGKSLLFQMLRDSLDPLVKNAQPSEIIGQKWKAKIAVENPESAFKMKEIIGTVANGSAGLGLHLHLRNPLSSSSSSYRAGSTDIPDPLSPLLPIVHRPR